MARSGRGSKGRRTTISRVALTYGSSEEVELFVREAGAGSLTLLFIHGWPASGAVWSGQLGRFPGIRTVAVDLPGFGGSAPIKETTIANLAMTIHRFVTTEASDGLVLVGWSMGARIAANVAGRLKRAEPSGLRGLVLVEHCPRLLWNPDDLEISSNQGVRGLSREYFIQLSDAWHKDPRGVIADLTTKEFAQPELHKETIDEMIREGLRADHDAALAAMVDAYRSNTSDILPTIRLPTLLVYGSETAFVHARCKELAAKLIPNVRVEHVQESNHNPMLENAEAFNCVVKDFSKALPAFNQVP